MEISETKKNQQKRKSEESLLVFIQFVTFCSFFLAILGYYISVWIMQRQAPVHMSHV